MDRTAVVLIVFTILGIALAAIYRRISPPKKIEPPADPTKRTVEFTMWLASFIIWFISILAMRVFLVKDIGAAFLLAVIPFIISLPFTFFTTFFYRKTQLPFRFELPAAIVVGGLGSLVYWIVSVSRYYFQSN